MGGGGSTPKSYTAPSPTLLVLMESIAQRPWGQELPGKDEREPREICCPFLRGTLHQGHRKEHARHEPSTASKAETWGQKQHRRCFLLQIGGRSALLLSLI